MSEFWNKASRLKSPTSKLFSLEEWQSAFDACSSVSDADTRLFESAKFIAIEMAAMRSKYPDRQNNLGAILATQVALATVNVQFGRYIKRHLNQTRETLSKPGITTLAYASERPVDDGSGQKVPGGADMETLLSGLESWLYDIQAGAAMTEVPSNLGSVMEWGANRYSYHFTLNSFWNDALWYGECVVNPDSEMCRWEIVDKEYASLREAWRIRSESVGDEFAHIDMDAFKYGGMSVRKRLALPKVVTAVAWRKGRLKVKIAPPDLTTGEQLYFVADNARLDRAYFSHLVDLPLPNYPFVTCRKLNQAWHLLCSLIACIERHTHLKDPMSPESMATLAYCLPKSIYVDLFMSGMGIDERQAIAILSFLSTQRSESKKGDRGVWAYPLVKMPQSDSYGIVKGVLFIGSAIRKVEAWLERGGLDDSKGSASRGDQYENRVRQGIISAMQGNKLFQSATCVPYGISKSSECPEQIDLLFSVGNLIVVGEIKCLLYPSEPHEVAGYRKRLSAAAKQAATKCGMLKGRPDLVSKHLKIAKSELINKEYIPIVALNQSIGASLREDGVSFIDVKFLTLYLAENSYYSGEVRYPSGAVERVSTQLYSSEEDAAARFVQTMENPPFLKDLVGQVYFDTTLFPLPSGKKMAVELPFLGEAPFASGWAARR